MSGEGLSGSFAPLSLLLVLTSGAAATFFHREENSTGWDLEIHRAVHKGCKQVKSALAHESCS